MHKKLEKTDREWRKELTFEVYRILRKKNTEKPFTGKYYKHKETGTYNCAGCGNPLFNSETKFESDSGWPSFSRPVLKDTVATKIDRCLGMIRIEVLCAHCGGHLGHLFKDGPQPTGLRYCINSLSLNFKKLTTENIE